MEPSVHGTLSVSPELKVEQEVPNPWYATTIDDWYPGIGTRVCRRDLAMLLCRKGRAFSFTLQ